MEYIEVKKAEGVSERTLEIYSQIIQRYERSGLDPMAYLSQIENPSTRALHARVLSAYFDFNGENPLKGFRVKCPKTHPAVLSADEVQALISACRGKRNKAIVALMVDTGLRVSEVCNLDVGDVKDGMVMVRQGKGKKDRIVFFSETTKELIGDYIGDHDSQEPNRPLFVSHKTGERLDRWAVYQIIHRLGGKIGKDISPHTLRHSFATLYTRNGGDPHSLAKLMGHTSTKIAERYVHLVARDVEMIYQKCSPLGNGER